MDEEEMILPSAGKLFFFWERESIPGRWILISITYIVYGMSVTRDDPNPDNLSEISYGAVLLFIFLFSLTLGPIIDVFLALIILYLRFLGFFLLIFSPPAESPPAPYDSVRNWHGSYGGSHSRRRSSFGNPSDHTGDGINSVDGGPPSEAADDDG